MRSLNVCWIYRCWSLKQKTLTSCFYILQVNLNEQLIRVLLQVHGYSLIVRKALKCERCSFSYNSVFLLRMWKLFLEIEKRMSLFIVSSQSYRFSRLAIFLRALIKWDCTAFRVNVEKQRDSIGLWNF